MIIIMKCGQMSGVMNDNNDEMMIMIRNDESNDNEMAKWKWQMIMKIMTNEN